MQGEWGGPICPVPLAVTPGPQLFLISTLSFPSAGLPSPIVNQGLALTGRNIHFQALARHLVAMSQAVFLLAELELPVSLVTAT